jgi:very-short-patch-repair endonuclease
MKFKTLNGKEKLLKNASKYLINWRTKTRSKFQDEVKKFLKAYWNDDFVFEELRLVDTRMTFDFYNANKKIAIEVQGQQHTKFVPFFHGNRNKFLQQLKRDNKKLEFCEMNGIKLVEIYSISELNKDFFESYEIYL